MKHLIKVYILLLFSFLYFTNSEAQLFKEKNTFSHADTLRGAYGTSRNWWDVLKYDLHVQFNIDDSSVSGYNIIDFKVLKKGNLMQIDLQEPMMIDSILQNCLIDLYDSNGNLLKTVSRDFKSPFTNDGNAWFVSSDNLIFQKQNKLTVYFHGKPRVAVMPPWNGGSVWGKDKKNNPWVSIACQGLGASVWYPCKDHQQDEPDSAEMHVTIPDSLVCVGNGLLRGINQNSDRTSTYNWAVVNPINNYNLIPYIGKYVHFSEVFKGGKGNLNMDYWVLDYNLEKAKKQFLDAPRMMKAFEYWFGPYPFYEDGYKLVEAPYLGMEHQSAIAYGNAYRNGYYGKDLSGTGWGDKWDFIIVHESGHEWFGNNITSNDLADMWIHEGFTNYSEVLFTEFYYGKKAANAYVQGIRMNIANDEPIIGPYGVNREGSSDMYYKASNMLHTIRQIINNDTLFRKILRGLNKTFYHQTVTTGQIENYISKESKINLSKIFDQYLRTTQIPVLEYKVRGHTLSYRWTNCIPHFNMPVRINFKGSRMITPTEQWQTQNFYPEGNNKFSVDPNFYLKTKKVD